jgi:hypothetical protein
MMACLRNPVPDFAAKMQSFVLSGGLSQIERLETDFVLGVWGNKWIDVGGAFQTIQGRLSLSKCLIDSSMSD